MSFMSVQWMWNPSESTNDYGSPVTIDRCRQLDGTIKYAVRQSGACLSRNGEWEFEPIPSSRTDEFFKSFRFDTWQDAANAILNHCKPQGRFHQQGAKR